MIMFITTKDRKKNGKKSRWTSSLSPFLKLLGYLLPLIPVRLPLKAAHRAVRRRYWEQEKESEWERERISIEKDVDREKETEDEGSIIIRKRKMPDCSAKFHSLLCQQNNDIDLIVSTNRLLLDLRSQLQEWTLSELWTIQGGKLIKTQGKKEAPKIPLLWIPLMFYYMFRSQTM